MRFLGPTPSRRLNEAAGFVYLVAGLLLALALASYHPLDPSWDTASAAVRPLNLIGRAGAVIADLCYQLFGLVAAVLPFLLWVLGWKWMRSEEISAPVIRVAGSAALVMSIAAGLDLTISWRPWGGAISCGGLAGTLAGDWLVSLANPLGAVLLAFATAILSLYLISSFSVLSLERWFAGPIRAFHAIGARWTAWRERRRAAAKEREALRRAKREQERAEKLEARKRRRAERAARAQEAAAAGPSAGTPPWEEQAHIPETAGEPEPEPEEAAEEIPIHVLEDLRPVAAAPPPPPEPPPAPIRAPEPPPSRPAAYQLPSTDLLNEVPARNPHDSVELKEIAARIKSKFEEFNVLGSVVQINPGPVVTTFEYKPEAGVKYSKITALSEDLCLGLQAESILIERIPGKPTVGIEVPNSRRELISLRQILESEEFDQSASKLTMCLGKDISGRIKVSALESMPHLLIAGSTGAGKSVMLNTLIMSILYKSTPDDVRLILVDPKRVELGIYEGIPHLLTPVITDAKKATNALRNAVLEMERRLKLLASVGVRNLEQFNRKVRQMQSRPLSLFDEENTEPDLTPLPSILILIDELADLMMLERANVEEAVTRLAQMARAVGCTSCSPPSVPASTSSPASSRRTSPPASASASLPASIPAPSSTSWAPNTCSARATCSSFRPAPHGSPASTAPLSPKPKSPKWSSSGKPKPGPNTTRPSCKPLPPTMSPATTTKPKSSTASRIPCTRTPSASCSKWAKPRPQRCSAASASATAAPPASST